LNVWHGFLKRTGQAQSGKDGFVSVDLSNEEAMKAIRDQMDKLEGIKTSTVKAKHYYRTR
jgi:hypothetical protein